VLAVYSAAAYFILQCVFVYVPMSYPKYAASIFVGNDLCRPIFAFGVILFARPMYLNLGIGQGISLLAELSTVGILGMWVLFFYGQKRRAKSKFAVS
jgi:MFS transporter, DHA1 family, multidrug resistance protein